MYTLSPIIQSDRVLGRPCKRWEDAVLSYRPDVDGVDIDDGGDGDDDDEQIEVSS